MINQQSDRESLLDQIYQPDQHQRRSSNFRLQFIRQNSSSNLFSLSNCYKRRRTFRNLFFVIVTFLSILAISFALFDWSPSIKVSLKHFDKNIPSSSKISDLVSSQFVSYESILKDNFSFNINGSDVMVFLHIQKTGGTTFGKHLVQDIDLEAPCICHRKKGKKLNLKKPAKKMLRCECFRPNSLNSNWLFSRYSVGWKCGLHADWTELRECVDDYLNSKEGTRPRRYFYVTLLRDPVERYLSEFRHVQRGATWKGSTHMCSGKPLSKEEVPPCFDEDKGIWSGVTLKDFIECPTNWATNRQTRMLADLRLVHCYNMTAMTSDERDAAMLESAKINLEQLAFYGLTELQKETQYMFEETFNLNFRIKFEQQSSSKSDANLDPDVLEQIVALNRLDIELYDFAKKLMLRRFDAAKSQDGYFEDHFNHSNLQDVQSFNFNQIGEENDYEY